MTSKFKLEIYVDRPPEFWRDMGPFFAFRSVRREMPYLADEPGYTWFVIRDTAALQDYTSTVVAFASLHVDKAGVGHLHSLYVTAANRKTGLAAKLIDDRLAYLLSRDCKIIRTTANANSMRLFVDRGFKALKERGQYLEMEKTWP